MLTKEKLSDLLKKSFVLDHLDIIDESPNHHGHKENKGGGHFKIIIASLAFTNLNTLKRHRLIYQSLESLMPLEIHALSILTFTPEEYFNINPR